MLGFRGWGYVWAYRVWGLRTLLLCGFLGLGAQRSGPGFSAVGIGVCEKFPALTCRVGELPYLLSS